MSAPVSSRPEKTVHDASVSTNFTSLESSVPMLITTGKHPAIKVDITRTVAKIDITPAWFDPVPSPDRTKIRQPSTYDTNSSTDQKIVTCLANYRSMTKEKSLDFLKHPISGSVNDTETLIIALQQVTDEHGIELSFTNSQFSYNDSDYRTACGISDLGSIHSIIARGSDIQTAKFRFQFSLNYHTITQTVDALKNFILRFIKAVAKIIQCEPQFIRVFAIENDPLQDNNMFVNFGLTAPSETRTVSLARKLQIEASRTVATADVLQYLKAGPYEYELHPAIRHLQLQRSDLEPKYNIDYSQGFPSEARRGGRPYYLPIPWYRHALKVEDKYPQDKLWLGMDNKPGEWSVAYHGTKYSCVQSITQQGFLHSMVGNDLYRKDAINMVGSKADVKGIYLATHCERGADRYATKFSVKNCDGKKSKYHVVFQCRVEPNKYTEHDGPVTDGKALRVFEEKAIRPYGVLLKQVSGDTVNSSNSYSSFPKCSWS